MSLLLPDIIQNSARHYGIKNSNVRKVDILFTHLQTFKQYTRRRGPFPGMINHSTRAIDTSLIESRRLEGNRNVATTTSKIKDLAFRPRMLANERNELLGTDPPWMWKLEVFRSSPPDS